MQQYLIDQFNKDIQKSESKIQKQMKKMEKYDIELNKLREQADNSSTNQDLQ